MSTESPYPGSRAEPQDGREWTSDALAERNAQERDDVEEDRRRQRELDDGELGGEA
jgi:hypothetical protein